jgi:hypothetical protein
MASPVAEDARDLPRDGVQYTPRGGLMSGRRMPLWNRATRRGSGSACRCGVAAPTPAWGRGGSDAAEQFGWRDIERPRDPPDHIQTRVPAAAFDAADIGPVEIGPLGEGLLRQPAFLS